MEWHTKINLEVSQRERRLRKYRDLKIVQETVPTTQFFNGSGTFLPNETKIFFHEKSSKSRDDRPLIVFPDGHIFFETFSPHHSIAKNFLETIANPISLPDQIQEYQINTNSILSAINKGIDEETFIYFLRLLSKNKIESALIDLIIKTYQSFSGLLILLYSKDELLLYSNKRKQLEDAYLSLQLFSIKSKGIEIMDDSHIVHSKIFGIFDPNETTCELSNGLELIDQDSNEYFCFKLMKSQINEIKKKLEELEIYFISEYDFHTDLSIPNIEIKIKDEFQLFPYQNECLNLLFQNNYFRSGIVSLPYGSGKSGIGAFVISKIRKPTIIFCENLVSIDKWIQSFDSFTNISKQLIVTFIPESDLNFITDDPCIILTTYSYFLSNKNIDQINLLCSKTWGLFIFDELEETHLNTIITINEKVKSYSKIGLSSFHISNDQAIRKFNYVIGPQIYSKTWNDLSQNCFLPKVQCSIIYCKMTPHFFYEYTTSTNLLLRRLLSGLNPNKIMSLERLIRRHEDRKDKILVISDIQYILEKCAQYLFVDGEKRRPIITMKTPVDERERSFDRFRYHPEVSCLFLSRIIDKAIEIPPANVLIQITPYIGSKISETRRLAKLLKPKFNRTNNVFENSYYYILVSEDTKEMFCSNKTRQNLIESGFSVKPVYKYRKHSAFKQKLACQTRQEQLELHHEIMKTNLNNGALEILDEEKFVTTPSNLHISKTLPSMSMIGKKKDQNKYKKIYEK